MPTKTHERVRKDAMIVCKITKTQFSTNLEELAELIANTQSSPETTYLLYNTSNLIYTLYTSAVKVKFLTKSEAGELKDILVKKYNIPDVYVI